jgi:gluconolactonase
MGLALIITAFGCSVKQPPGEKKLDTKIHTESTAAENKSVVAQGARIEKIAGDFEFAEGPAVDPEGNVYFIDIRPNRIHRCSVDGTVSTFYDDIPGGANGLYFDLYGDLLVCAWLGKKVISVTMNREVNVLADSYKGKPLISPNDLWVGPGGGIYFTDPNNNTDEGRFVYYIIPERNEVIWMKDVTYKPNGLVGTPDGKQLYVIEYHAGRTYVHNIDADGTLTGKKLFAPDGEDGLTIDSEGNVYITTKTDLAVYDRSGKKIETIEFPERPTNVCFGGRDRKMLFVTTVHSLYSLRMRVKGT